MRLTAYADSASVIGNRDLLQEIGNLRQRNPGSTCAFHRNRDKQIHDFPLPPSPTSICRVEGIQQLEYAEHQSTLLYGFCRAFYMTYVISIYV